MLYLWQSFPWDVLCMFVCPLATWSLFHFHIPISPQQPRKDMNKLLAYKRNLPIKVETDSSPIHKTIFLVGVQYWQMMVHKSLEPATSNPVALVYKPVMFTQLHHASVCVMKRGKEEERERTDDCVTDNHSIFSLFSLLSICDFCKSSQDCENTVFFLNKQYVLIS